MKISNLLKELDQMVSQGRILEAFESFFHDDVVTHSDAGDRSEGKAQKRGFLSGFLNNMKSTDEIVLHDALTDGETTYSQYTFRFTNNQDEPLVWHEVIRRVWKDGQVVDEYYYNGDLNDLKKQLADNEKADKKALKAAPKEAKKPKKAAEAQKPKADKPAAEKKTKKSDAAPKTAKPAAEKKTKKSDAAPKAATKDNLKLVEGIGPKIEKLLNEDGIMTFKDLAAAKQTQLKKVLANAGPRFSMHSPETWPKQAKLLAAGKTDELKAYQDELKGGRVV